MLKDGIGGGLKGKVQAVGGAIAAAAGGARRCCRRTRWGLLGTCSGATGGRVLG